MNVERATVGKDKIRYLLFKRGYWRWRPRRAPRESGFRDVVLGPGLVVDSAHVPAPDDVKRAVLLNQDWDRYRKGLPTLQSSGRYPAGSVGDGFERAIRLREAERREKGIVWTAEQRSRDDWPRAWKYLEPLFGDCDPNTLAPEIMLQVRADIAQVSESEAHRTIKVWRALWKKMAAFGYCHVDRDPSFLFANTAPLPRQAVWHEGEIVRLVKRAWREGYTGLAACLAVAWDSQLSPVDARMLRSEQLRRDPIGSWFDVARAKTGRAAKATLSKRAEQVLRAYLASLSVELVGPIFRNRSGRPYSKDTLGDDFKAVRELVFGMCETRQLADFRRSGTIEALAGDAPPEKLSSKMANSLSQSNRLHKTYGPVQLASVRDTDAARRRGRTKLREQNQDESRPAPAKESPARET
jgi:hypothetical protein